MHANRSPSGDERSLATSAHQLQRAAGNLQKHAANAEAVPTLRITLAHIQETLDRLSVGMFRMANAVVDWCGEQGPDANEDALPPQAYAPWFQLPAEANTLEAPKDACTSSRMWTRRLLDAGHEPVFAAGAAEDPPALVMDVVNRCRT